MDQDQSPPTAQPLNDVLRYTADIVSAMLRKTKIAPDALPATILSVSQTLSALGQSVARAAQPQPYTTIRKSLSDPRFIICLEDGRKLKMLKRHLKTSYNLTPNEYRAKWGLPVDYPMVAPAYASRRSELAKHIGLGHKPAIGAGPKVLVEAEPVVTLIPQRKRGPKPKVKAEASSS